MSINPPSLEHAELFNNIQGNILKSHGRKHTAIYLQMCNR